MGKKQARRKSVLYLNIAGQDITNKNQFWAPLPAKSVWRIQWVVYNNHVRGNKTFTHFVRSAQMDFQPYFASRYAQNWFYLSSVLQCYTATPKTDFRLLYIGMLFSYVPLCNVMAFYRKLISNALHKDVFGQKNRGCERQRARSPYVQKTGHRREFISLFTS